MACRAAGAIYYADFLTGFIIGFTVEHNLKRRVIMRPDLILRYYMLHNTFITDFLSTFAIIAEVRSLFAPLHSRQQPRDTAHSACLTASLACQPAVTTHAALAAGLGHV